VLNALAYGGAMLTQISLFEGVLDFKPPFPDI
jgi:hypothetical protein